MVALSVGVLLIAGGCSVGGSKESVADVDGAPVQPGRAPEEGRTTDGEAFVPVGADADQRASLEDGVVTREEYEAGFRQYEACMTALGIELLEKDIDAPVLSTGHLSQGTVEEENCYYAEFEQLDIAWQVENYDYSNDIAALVACLTTAGVTPEYDSSAKSIRQYETLDAQREEATIAVEPCLPLPPS